MSASSLEFMTKTGMCWNDIFWSLNLSWIQKYLVHSPHNGGVPNNRDAAQDDWFPSSEAIRSLSCKPVLAGYYVVYQRSWKVTFRRHDKIVFKDFTPIFHLGQVSLLVAGLAILDKDLPGLGSKLITLVSIIEQYPIRLELFLLIPICCWLFTVKWLDIPAKIQWVLVSVNLIPCLNLR